MTSAPEPDAPPNTADVFAAIAEIRDSLLRQGGAFELAEEQVGGARLPVFVNRRARLLDWLVDSTELGDRPCLVQGDRTLSYAEHAAAVAQLAAVLAGDYGIGPGDRVAIVAANSPDWLLTFWAGVALGAVVVAGNAWWSATEAAHSLGRTGPTLVVADAKRAALLKSLSGFDVPILRIDDIAGLVSGRGQHTLPDTRPALDDPAVVVFTSGTTGHPKGAVHSHGNMLSVIEYHRYTDAVLDASSRLTGRPPRQIPRRFLMSLPLFHIASLHNLAVPRLTTGDTVVIDEGRFDVDRVLRLIERERVTNWAVVPTMAHRLVSHGPLDAYDVSSLTALSINSAPSSPALKDRMRAAVPAVQTALADSYGLTEACTAATVATPVDLALHPSTVGPPIPSVSVSIRSADGVELPDGVEGEIWLRSQFTMLGYWDDPAATAAIIDADAWLHTGDLGSMRDGRLFMASRRSDLILRGGENVYPAEIEAALDEHPAVAECAVFGVDDEDLGQAVAVVVVCDADGRSDAATPTEPALRAWLGERLAYYKVPAHWRITTDPLARTATGKVIRRALRV